MKKISILIFLLSSFTIVKSQSYEELIVLAKTKLEQNDAQKSVLYFKKAFYQSGCIYDSDDQYLAITAGSKANDLDWSFKIIRIMLDEQIDVLNQKIIEELWENTKKMQEDERWDELMKIFDRIDNSLVKKHVDSLHILHYQYKYAVSNNLITDEGYKFRDKIITENLIKNKFEEIIKITKSWPDDNKYGKYVAKHMFIVLRDIEDLNFQKQYYPLLLKAAKKDIVPMWYCGILDDLIRVSKGKEQLYGTQCVALTGELYPVRNPKKLLKRRKKMEFVEINLD